MPFKNKRIKENTTYKEQNQDLNDGLQNGTGSTSKNNIGQSPNGPRVSFKREGSISINPTLEEQLCLLGLDGLSDDTDKISTGDVKDTTIFSSDLLEDPAYNAMLPQYGLLGNSLPPHGVAAKLPFRADRRLFLNTNIPWSTFICGVQGSGKSHTMSCLLESSLISSRTLGVLKRPLSALVFYFGQYASLSNFQPCEAAYLSSPSPQFQGLISAPSVNVLASPSNAHNLRTAYTQIPGVNVRALKLKPEHLNVSSMLALMSIDQSHSSSLYMAHVVKILRGMAEEATGSFDFRDFKRRLDDANFTDMQRKPLNQRIELLESYLDLEDRSNCFNFESGSITIIDLSCPFMDVSTACVLFNICMGVYLESSGPENGKIVAVDEAHKYLTNTAGSKAFTESILGVIRQQRHYGAHIIISTQEPTISPRLIDLCSMVIIHRFTSPSWFGVLRKHMPTEEEKEGIDLFNRIVSLRTGEALLFAPLGLVSHFDTVSARLNSSLLRVKVRKRVTYDGGKSVVACDTH